MRISCTHTRPLYIQIQPIQLQRVTRLNHDQTSKRASPTIAEKIKEKIMFRKY
jgi:hypothetical protein